MKIVSFKICPFVQRVTALLEVKGQSYDVEYINLSEKPDWFLKASPNAQVPILVTDSNEVLFESDAIIEYIEETVSEPLFSRNPVKKAQQRAWSYLAAKHYLVQCGAQRSKDKGTLEERSARLSKAFGKLDGTLSQSGFIGGSKMGMVDIAWLPLLHRAAIIEKNSGYDFLRDWSKLRNLQRKILETGVCERSVSTDFEEKFCSFYLAEETYLGQCTKAKSGAACCGEAECSDEDFECCC